MSDFNSLILRKAAGCYYIIDPLADGLSYVPPICTNETGAMLFKLIKEGLSPEEIIKAYSKHYEISAEQASEDYLNFVEAVLKLED